MNAHACPGRIAALAAAFAAGPAAAQTTLYKDPATGEVFADSAPYRVEFKTWNIDFWGRLYLQHRTESSRDPNAGATARRHYNAFEATRAYVGARGSLADWGQANVLLDVVNRSGTEGYDAYVKQAYFETPRLIRGNPVRFGQIGLPWIGFEEGIWGYRAQGTIFVDREGYEISDDRGVGIKGTLYSLLGLTPHLDPWDAFKNIEYDVTFTNGEGRLVDEVNSGKAWRARLTWNVPYVPGLRLSGYGLGHRVDATHLNHRYMANAAYTRGPLTLGVTGLWTLDQERANVPAANRTSIPTTRTGNVDFDGDGLSVYGRYNLPFDAARRLAVFGRFDTFDPDHATAENSHDRWIAGLSFRPNKNLMFLVDWDEIDYERNARTGTATAADRSTLYIQTQVDF